MKTNAEYMAKRDHAAGEETGQMEMWGRTWEFESVRDDATGIGMLPHMKRKSLLHIAYTLLLRANVRDVKKNFTPTK